MRTRLSWPRPVALAAVLWAALATGVPVAQAKVGPRVTIGVYGDSVAEGYTIPNYLRDSLVPQLRTGLARAGGFQLGGTGLIPANSFRWRFNEYTLTGESPPLGGWLLAGLVTDPLDGPSGYNAIALSPEASATAPVDAASVAILFTKFSGSGIFTVTAGAKTFALDGRSTGPPTPTEQWITLPPGAGTITVHGPRSGIVVLDGAIARGAVNPGRIGVEVENLGHMGRRLAEYASPRVLASLVQQRFGISVFLSAYLWELADTIEGRHAETGYTSELRARVRLVRSYGGRCLVVDSSPLPIAASIIARFAAINRQVAREEGCAYTGALAHLWRPATAVKSGITLADQIHPRAPGYRLMAQALVPELVKLVRERVRTRRS